MNVSINKKKSVKFLILNVLPSSKSKINTLDNVVTIFVLNKSFELYSRVLFPVFLEYVFFFKMCHVNTIRVL